MAATSLPREIAASITYTYTTESSSDWSSVPVSTYFFDKTNKLVYYKDSLGTIIPIYSTGEYTYEIGQYVAAEGGVIFHRWKSTSALGTPTAGTIQNYLVLDLTDVSLSAPYSTIDVDISNVESYWNGFTNTANLIAAGAGSGITVGTAAELCDSLVSGGKSDWYLPAAFELLTIYKNLWDVQRGIETATGTTVGITEYWSSTETDASTAIIFTFNDGLLQNSKKNSPIYAVRAVRRFSTQ
jgi:hypothetical protein